MWALSLMAIPLALTGVKNYLSGAFIEAGHSVKRIQGYESGLTGNPNDLALTLNILLSLSLGLLFSAGTASARGLLMGIVLVEVAGVVVTFSRSGFLTLATIVALYLWRLARRGRAGWAAAVLVACLLGFAVLPSEYVARIATITSIESDTTGSSQQRWNDMVAALSFRARESHHRCRRGHEHAGPQRRAGRGLAAGPQRLSRARRWSWGCSGSCCSCFSWVPACGRCGTSAAPPEGARIWASCRRSRGHRSRAPGLRRGGLLLPHRLPVLLLLHRRPEPWPRASSIGSSRRAHDLHRQAGAGTDDGARSGLPARCCCR